MPGHIPNPFEELAARLSRLEELLYELRDMVSCSKDSLIDKEKIGGVELAMQVTGLARSTIYNLTSEGKIAHMKRGKRIYFSYQQLFDWLKEGKQNTLDDVQAEVNSFLSRQSTFIKSYKTR